MIAACVVASAFFSGFETALTSISEIRARQLLDSGASGRRILGLWLERPNRVLTTILIGNNLVNMLASALTTDVTYALIGERIGEGSRVGIAVAVGVITFLVLVFGEIFPKTYARHNAEKYLRLSGILVAFYLSLYPVASLFVRLSRGIARVLGAKITKDGPLVRIEDIEHMVRVGAEADALDQDEARYLSGVLELSERVAREIMVPRTDLTIIEEGEDLDSVMEIIREDRFSRYPVFRDRVDEIVGILYVKDLLDLLGTSGQQGFDLRRLLRPAHFVPETLSVRDLLAQFQAKKVHLAVVVDEHGGTSGIVTLEDVLEEIVGEIYDEYDDAAEIPIQSLDDGAFDLDGGAPLHDVEDALHIEFPDDRDYDTIAGFVVHEAGDLPEEGYSVDFGGYTFTVREADERRVERVEARPSDPQPKAD